MIVDRNDEPLAISTPVESVAASPADVEIDAGADRSASRACSRSDAAELEQRARRYQARVRLPQAPAAARARPRKWWRSAYPGVFLQREYRRYYPAGEVMAHLIGFTDVDDRGQEALELAFEERARRQAGQPPRDQGPARPHRRGRREHPRAAERPRRSRSRSTRASSTSPIAS